LNKEELLLIEGNKKIFKDYPTILSMREIKKKKFREPCKNCHKKSYYISEQGLCKKCMAEKILFARSQIKNKSGPIYEKWKSRLVASLEKL